ncbi:hypothetical protein E3P86_01634 [Wallemia ichthyophaga]|uniref:FAD dependent oxidoreductase domain-containing protein n=2 Tax=Wallemia ichthyophaga TaxID=245174 RepID=A0A4T0J8D6_WALIC|nr:hypothetical protein E3P86_01634 [Wallemia ichthyophaga]
MPSKIAERLSNWNESANDRIADSWFGRYFRLDGSGHKKARAGAKFTQEIRAGITTFVAMAYIISVNSNILRQCGGTCRCSDYAQGCDDPGYSSCTEDFYRDMITATSAISCIGSLLMGLMANLPVAVGPGLGLNAYFANAVVGPNNSGRVNYETALGAVFLEGVIFVVLAMLGVRAWLARLVPRSVALAAGAGIGFYVAFVGLSGSGLNVIGKDPSNIVGLAGCPDGSSSCGDSVTMRSPTMWLGIFCGGVVTVYMMLYRVKGAMFLGIILVSIISWPRPTPVTYFPYTDEGQSRFDFFKQVVTYRSIKQSAGVLNFDYGDGHTWIALISFLYVDLLDATGTLYSMARFAGVMNERTLDFENSTMAYTADGLSILIGSTMGSSPATAFIESAAGIAEGGKTGITALTCSVFFFISIFFGPIFASFPSWATGGTLVIVGSLMAKNIVDINWGYLGDAIPAFLTVIMMPLSYNIAYGLIAGICSYVALNSIPAAIRYLTKNKISPPDWDRKDVYWETQRAYFVPPWMKRLAKGDKRFWRGDDDDESYYDDDYQQEMEAESITSSMRRERLRSSGGTSRFDEKSFDDDSDEHDKTHTVHSVPLESPNIQNTENEVHYKHYKEDNVDVTIVENAEIAGAASGKAGGFLAKDWHASATESLGYLSYDLHKRLAEELDGRTRWHYRALQTSNVVLKATQATGNSKPKANVVHDGEEPFRPRPPPKGESNIDWISKPLEDARGVISHEMVSDEDTTAQVEPYLFTTSILEEAKKNGVKVVKGSVKEYMNKSVTLESGESIPADKLVLAAGPWTSSVFDTLFDTQAHLPIEALPGYSLVLRPTSMPSAHAAFTTILGYDSVENAMSGTPELFSRLDGTVYVAGENEGPELPPNAGQVAELALTQEERWDKLRAAVYELGPSLAGAEVVKKQLCYRPLTYKKRPMISSLKSLVGDDVFVASGMGPWGISLGPGTGLVLSELVLGKAHSADVSKLSVENFET